jgi:hypothetical protein
MEKYKTLDDCLKILLEKADNRPISIKQILHTLQGKGALFILVFLALPFCQPITLPGLSTPFGIVIMFIGLRFAFRRKEWLPKFILKKTISPKLLKNIAGKCLYLMKKLKRWIHPRYKWICTHRFSMHLHGVVIIILGLLLALPLPIPLSNIIVAWPLVLLGLGLMKEDGLFIAIGYTLFLICVIFFGFVLSIALHEFLSMK